MRTFFFHKNICTNGKYFLFLLGYSGISYGKIDLKFRLYIKKISRKATSLSKRVIWEKKIKGWSRRQER